MLIRSSVALAALLISRAGAAQFEAHEIATGLKGGYQVIAVDMNRDGKPDLIALAPGTEELVWFENPGWQRHIILSNVPHMINCAAWDIDGDGIPEIALAYEFSNNASKSQGVVAILRHSGDDAKQPWTASEIDRLPTSHRLRWADIYGNGKKVLINAPLTNAGAQKPEDHLPVPLVYYDPADWKRHVISQENQGVQHGIYITDWDGKGREAILTASFSGIHLDKLEPSGTWAREKLSGGSPDAWPKSGASDIALGFIKRRSFLASIEPWHGNQVAVYRKIGKTWKREVIETAIADGHTIQTGDFDLTGATSIVVGERGGEHSLYLYNLEGKKWRKTTVDAGGMAAAACLTVDLNGDRRLDIVCIGSATANLKWYENKGNQPR